MVSVGQLRGLEPLDDCRREPAPSACAIFCRFRASLGTRRWRGCLGQVQAALHERSGPGGRRCNRSGSRGADLRLDPPSYKVLTCLEHEVQSRLSTVRLLPPGQDEDGFVVDLLFASSGIEPELAAAATELEVLPGVYVPVATIGHLLALKVLAMDDATRPQDRIDILALLEYADESEVARAQESIALITARGFNRSKNLSERLQAFAAMQKR